MNRHKRNKREKRRLGLYRQRRKLRECGALYGLGGYSYNESKGRIERYYTLSPKSKKDFKKERKRVSRRKLLFIDEECDLIDTKLPNVTYNPKEVVVDNNYNKHTHDLTTLL